MDENVAIINVSQKQQHVTVKNAGGLRGLTGAKGDAGAALQITGSVDNYASLPTDLTEDDAGKAYFNQDDGKLYVWSGTRFPEDGQGSQFKGDPGPAGPQGFSPTATVRKVDDTTTITITDKNGTTTANVYDGEEITDGLVTGAANNATTVIGSKIALSTVGTPNLRDDAVTIAKIAEDELKQAILNQVYPVGSIYISATLSTTMQVSNVLGGTWASWGSGRVPVGVNANDADFNISEKTGGNKSNTYSFDHRHPIATTITTTNNVSGIGIISNNEIDTGLSSAATANPLNDKVISTVQPYITCYMYKRTG